MNKREVHGELKFKPWFLTKLKWDESRRKRKEVTQKREKREKRAKLRKKSTRTKRSNRIESNKKPEIKWKQEIMMVVPVGVKELVPAL
jgi:hypothetical protein